MTLAQRNVLSVFLHLRCWQDGDVIQTDQRRNSVHQHPSRVPFGISGIHDVSKVHQAGFADARKISKARRFLRSQQLSESHSVRRGKSTHLLDKTIVESRCPLAFASLDDSAQIAFRGIPDCFLTKLVIGFAIGFNLQEGNKGSYGDYRQSCRYSAFHQGHVDTPIMSSRRPASVLKTGTLLFRKCCGPIWPTRRLPSKWRPGLTGLSYD